jgi:hypothetical protein
MLSLQHLQIRRKLHVREVLDRSILKDADPTHNA